MRSNSVDIRLLTDEGGEPIAVQNDGLLGIAAQSAAIDPLGKFLWLCNDSTITTYPFSGATGQVGESTGSITLAGSTGTCKLTMHPSGRYLIAAISTNSRTVSLSIDPATGALRDVETRLLSGGTIAYMHSSGLHAILSGITLRIIEFDPANGLFGGSTNISLGGLTQLTAYRESPSHDHLVIINNGSLMLIGINPASGEISDTSSLATVSSLSNGFVGFADTHLAHHPFLPWVAFLNNADGTIRLYSYEGGDHFSLLQSIAASGQHCFAFQFHPTGNTFYCSNGAYLRTYSLSMDGTATAVSSITASGWVSLNSFQLFKVRAPLN
ncbi:MAG: hypothetical protein AB7F66_14475 [Bacteriovoracia bacterium]